jgi:hypothetical protein
MRELEGVQIDERVERNEKTHYGHILVQNVDTIAERQRESTSTRRRGRTSKASTKWDRRWRGSARAGLVHPP